MKTQFEIELTRIRDLISLEAGDAVGLASKVDAIITSLTDVSETSLSAISDTISLYRDFSGPQREILALVGKHNFADLAKIVIAKPTGLYVTYLELLNNYLIPGADYCTALFAQIDNFTGLIGRIVNNRNDRIAINDMYEGTSAIAESRYTDMATINSARQSCFVTGGTEAEAKLETLVESNSQWRDIISKMNDVDKLLKSVPPKTMDSKVNKCVNYLRTLRVAANQGNMSDTSPEMLLRLSEYIEATARGVELYAVVYHDAISFAEAFKEATAKLKNILNEN